MLKMRHTRQHCFCMFFGEIDESLYQVQNAFANDLVVSLDIKSEIEGHLIVATSRRMEFLPGIADQLCQPLFNRHMDIFVGNVEHKLIRLYLFKNLLHAFNNILILLIRQNTLGIEHFGMCQRTFDIVLIEFFVEV